MKALQDFIKTHGLKRVATDIGIRYQSIQDWNRTGRIPAERVIAVERVTGISRHDLRPDIYPNESEPAGR